MRADRCRKVIGADISDDKMAECFTRLGVSFKKEGDTFVVDAPSYRFDIEIEEDLIEEVARLYGYQNLTEIPPLARVAMLERSEAKLDRHELRKKMAGLGFQELINYSFISEDAEADFAEVKDPIKVLNPIASQMAVMRTQLISGWWIALSTTSIARLIEPLCLNWAASSGVILPLRVPTPPLKACISRCILPHWYTVLPVPLSGERRPETLTSST